MMFAEMVAPDWLDVSRETVEDMRNFCRLVQKWNPAINLVGKSSASDLWERHALDSAQIYELAPAKVNLWCDIGSGGGFPGLVVAILAKRTRPSMKIVLVEADRRKAVFLGQAVRAFMLNATVLCARSEGVAPLHADVLSARAMAPLTDLCDHASRHLSSDGTALFMKGAAADTEIEAARKKWTFELVKTESRTAKAAAILSVRSIRRV